MAEVEGLLRGTFAAEQLAVGSVRCIATAELKRDEAAIGLLAERLGVPVRYFGADELNGMPGPSGASESQRLLGIVGVAEPAALLASGGDIIVPKVRSAAATLAVARINYPHPNPIGRGDIRLGTPILAFPHRGGRDFRASPRGSGGVRLAGSRGCRRTRGDRSRGLRGTAVRAAILACAPRFPARGSRSPRL